MFTILGIDPGSAAIGYGLIKANSSPKSKRASLIDYGAIVTSSQRETAFRLHSVEKKLSKIIREYRPDILAIESLYFFQNKKSVMGVSQTKGVILLVAEKAQVPIYEFTPLEIKQVLTGYGRAEKEEIQEAVQKILRLHQKPQPDHAADALGASLCFLLKNHWLKI
jgi:crossover junction endodeoxyribonuclease RuvC